MWCIVSQGILVGDDYNYEQFGGRDVSAHTKDRYLPTATLIWERELPHTDWFACGREIQRVWIGGSGLSLVSGLFIMHELSRDAKHRTPLPIPKSGRDPPLPSLEIWVLS